MSSKTKNYENLHPGRVIVTQPTGNVWDFENGWKHKLSKCCVNKKQCFCAFCCYCCFLMERNLQFIKFTKFDLSL